MDVDRLTAEVVGVEDEVRPPAYCGSTSKRSVSSGGAGFFHAEGFVEVGQIAGGDGAAIDGGERQVVEAHPLSGVGSGVKEDAQAASRTFAGAGGGPGLAVDVVVAHLLRVENDAAVSSPRLIN